MARSAALVIRVLSDVSGAQKGLGSAASGVDKFAGKVNTAAVVAGGALAGLGKLTLDAASDQQQALGGVAAVWGDYASEVEANARRASEAVGLSTADYATAATAIGGQLQRMGIDQAEAVKGTDDLITVAADLAATYGGTTQQAVEALGSAFRGEADPAEAFNLNLKQSAIDAEMAAQGTDKLTGAAAESAKAQAIMALVTEQSAAATGQFGEESDTAAVAQQKARAAWADAAASLGTALLPAVTLTADALAVLAGWISENEAATKTIVIAVTGFVAAIVALNAALTAYKVIATVTKAVTGAMRAAWVTTRVVVSLFSAATAISTTRLVALRVATVAMTAASKAARLAVIAWTAVQTVLNVVLAANPIGLIVIAILALVAGFILAYQNCETFRKIVDTAMDLVKKAIDPVVDAFNWVVDAIQSAVEWIKKLKFPSPPGWISDLFSAGGQAVIVGGPPSVRGLAAAPAATAGGPAVNVTFSGVVGDPHAVARQIRALMRDDRMRQGRYERGAYGPGPL